MAVVLFVHNLTCTLNDTGHTYDLSACSINRFYQYVQNQFNLAENLRCANPCFYHQNQAGGWQYKPCLVGHFCMVADVIFWERKNWKIDVRLTSAFDHSLLKLIFSNSSRFDYYFQLGQVQFQECYSDINLPHPFVLGLNVGCELTKWLFITAPRSTLK